MANRNGHARELMVVIAQAAINVAARPPELRGPWIFDEAELQNMARGARIYLERDAEAKASETGKAA